MRPSDLGRFWTRVRRDESGCWFWTGKLNRDGYARFSIKSGQVRAHRIAFEHWRGPIPVGYQLDHLCRIRHCVNPDHLEVVTARENTMAPGSLAITKQNLEKTHCPAGHVYDGENLYVDSTRRRHCRACAAEKGRTKYKQRKTEYMREWRRRNRELVCGG